MPTSSLQSGGDAGRGRQRIFHDNITLARGPFETGPVKNLDPSAMIIDQTCFLHGLQCKRHRFPVGPQKMGQELMCKWQILILDPVMDPEEPAAKSFLDHMQGVARDRLLNLSAQCLGIGDKGVARLGVAFK